ncbi:family 16 glycosylhydrolase [Pedobacter arcticus]|uniref:family 16 glycosylhydrolase n=1 Tax=Pedobacter arcticus TaxID=752140 RepID=UPI0002F103B9|nr:family 16 glycosylhydrolase [Pedobacter arcticus]
MKRRFLTPKVGMKLLFICTLFTACNKESLTTETQVTEQKTEMKRSVMGSSSGDYQLIWSDEFNSTGSFNSSKWQHCTRQTSAWNKYITQLPAYASQNGTDLVLKMDNATISGDPVPYHSGGVESSGKFNLTYGKIEVRAKFTGGRGSWPAIWMMPESATQHAAWPGCGEIDIMEHVNNEIFIHQTIHNNKVTNANGGSTATHISTFSQNNYNTYAIEWDPNSIKFFVNGSAQYTYNRANGGGWQQWPFDVPFYIILNQAGGAGWPGPITNADLPFSMQVDYVRVYKVSAPSNPGFESGSLGAWGAWQPSGTASVVSTDVRSGTKAIKETGGQTSIEQVITGLSPNTTYTFSGYAKVAASGQSVIMGVKAYGGSAIDQIMSSTSYTQGSVTFTTGSTNTSATVYFYKPNTGTAYGDDFSLQ